MSERGKIVRIHLKPRGYTEFVRFDGRLEINEMQALDACMKTASEASEPETPSENIIISGLKNFQEKTGRTYMLCPAPYLYDVIVT